MEAERTQLKASNEQLQAQHTAAVQRYETTVTAATASGIELNALRSQNEQLALTVSELKSQLKAAAAAAAPVVGAASPKSELELSTENELREANAQLAQALTTIATNKVTIEGLNERFTEEAESRRAAEAELVQWKEKEAGTTKQLAEAEKEVLEYIAIYIVL